MDLQHQIKCSPLIIPRTIKHRIVTTDHMNVILIYPHRKKETTKYLIIMNWEGCGQVKEPGSCLLESRQEASQLLDFSILGWGTSWRVKHIHLQNRFKLILLHIVSPEGDRLGPTRPAHTALTGHCRRSALTRRRMRVKRKIVLMVTCRRLTLASWGSLTALPRQT